MFCLLFIFGYFGFKEGYGLIEFKKSKAVKKGVLIWGLPLNISTINEIRNSNEIKGKACTKIRKAQPKERSTYQCYYSNKIKISNEVFSLMDSNGPINFPQYVFKPRREPLSGQT